MRDKDTILMESLIAEMGATSHQPLLTRTADTAMSKKPKIPATAFDPQKNTPESITAALQRAEILIADWLQIIQQASKELQTKKVDSDAKEIEELLGFITTAGNNILNQTNVLPDKNDFFIHYDNDEVGYEDILNRMLQATKVLDLDPESIIPTVDTLTGKKQSGLTSTKFGSNLKTKIPKETIESLYILIRAINIRLGRASELLNSRETHNRKESTGQDLAYYFSEIYNVRDEKTGKVIGNWDSEWLFYPNPIGIEMGLPPFDPKELRDIPQGTKKDQLPKTLPFVTTVFPPKEGDTYGEVHTMSKGKPIIQKNKLLGIISVTRSPRRPTDPKKRGPIVGFKTGDATGKTMEEVLTMINHEEAKEEFKKLYPQYKHSVGKVPNIVSDIKELEEAYQEIFNKRFLREDDDMKEFEKESEDKKDK